MTVKKLDTLGNTSQSLKTSRVESQQLFQINQQYRPVLINQRYRPQAHYAPLI